MNHSCDPNCKLEKWVVGPHMRLGIFALRDVHKGEELTFDYQFQRYGWVIMIWGFGERFIDVQPTVTKRSRVFADPAIVRELLVGTSRR